MKISYSNILAQAWQITKKNKTLWLFGAFASFISLEAVYEVIISQFSQLRHLDTFHAKLLALYQNQSEIFNLHMYFWGLFANDLFAYAFFILLIIIAFLFVWLVFTSQIFIIKNAARIYKGKKLDTNTALEQSFNHFWPVLGINILSKLIIYAGFIALSLPLLYALLTQNQSTVLSTNIFFFIAFTVFAVIISFITAYATNFVVLKDLHIFESYKQAWYLFSRNISISLEIAFILFFMKILSLILILCFVALFFIPAAALFMLSLSAANLLGLVASLTLIILSFTVISLIINSIFTTFYLSSWTITFTKLTEENLFSKVVHFLKTLPDSIKYEKMGIEKKQVVKQAKKLASQTEKQAKTLNRILENQYSFLAPKAKAQGKQLLQKLVKEYSRLKPIIAKEAKKEYTKLKPIVKKKVEKEIKRLRTKKQPKTKAKTKTKKQAKKKIVKKSVPKTVKKSKKTAPKTKKKTTTRARKR